MNETPLILAGQDIIECCKKIIPGQTNDVLLEKLQALIPNHTINLALEGDEWYKLGGVVDMDGKHVANDLIEWVERTYIECGQNLQTLIEHSLEQKLIATRQTGKTLYSVIQTGNSAEDFTGKKGTTLGNLLNRFDCQVGYSFAWYFYMLKGIHVTSYCAEGVYKDIIDEFFYLPDRDICVVKDWILQPYNL